MSGLVEVLKTEIIVVAMWKLKLFIVWSVVVVTVTCDTQEPKNPRSIGSASRSYSNDLEKDSFKNNKLVVSFVVS